MSFNQTVSFNRYLQVKYPFSRVDERQASNQEVHTWIEDIRIQLGEAEFQKQFRLAVEAVLGAEPQDKYSKKDFKESFKFPFIAAQMSQGLDRANVAKTAERNGSEDEAIKTQLAEMRQEALEKIEKKYFFSIICTAQPPELLPKILALFKFTPDNITELKKIPLTASRKFPQALVEKIQSINAENESYKQLVFTAEEAKALRSFLRGKNEELKNLLPDAKVIPIILTPFISGYPGSFGVVKLGFPINQAKDRKGYVIQFNEPVAVKIFYVNEKDTPPDAKEIINKWKKIYPASIPHLSRIYPGSIPNTVQPDYGFKYYSFLTRKILPKTIPQNIPSSEPAAASSMPSRSRAGSTFSSHSVASASMTRVSRTGSSVFSLGKPSVHPTVSGASTQTITPQAAEVGHGGGSKLYVVLPWLEGLSLSKVLRDQAILDPKRTQAKDYKQRIAPLAFQQKIDICCEIIDKVDFFHKKGEVHRDIKIDNTLCRQQPPNSTPPFKIKLLDLDTAKPNGEKITPDRVFSGTLCCMAPEIFLLSKQQGFYHCQFSHDIYSLGILLYLVLFESYDALPRREGAPDNGVYSDDDHILIRARARQLEAVRRGLTPGESMVNKIGELKLEPLNLSLLQNDLFWNNRYPGVAETSARKAIENIISRMLAEPPPGPIYAVERPTLAEIAAVFTELARNFHSEKDPAREKSLLEIMRPDEGSPPPRVKSMSYDDKALLSFAIIRALEELGNKVYQELHPDNIICYENLPGSEKVPFKVRLLNPDRVAEVETDSWTLKGTLHYLDPDILYTYNSGVTYKVLAMHTVYTLALILAQLWTESDTIIAGRARQLGTSQENEEAAAASSTRPDPTKVVEQAIQAGLAQPDLTLLNNSAKGNNFWNARYPGCDTQSIRNILLHMLRISVNTGAVAETAFEHKVVAPTLQNVKEVFVKILQHRKVLTIAPCEQQVTPQRRLRGENAHAPETINA